jgi:hypothetical protein
MKSKVILLSFLVIGLGLNMGLFAQVNTDHLVAKVQNLTHPELGLLKANKSDEIEITWTINPQAAAPVIKSDLYKLENVEVRLMAQLELGAPTPIATLHPTNEANVVRVRLRIADFEYLLGVYKPELQQFAPETKFYVHFGEFKVYTDRDKYAIAQIPDRQRYVGMMVN